MNSRYSGPDHFTGANQNNMAESTSKIQSKMNVTGNTLPLEDVMDLLDSGFFDCDEEIIQQVNSLESDVCYLPFSLENS